MSTVYVLQEPPKVRGKENEDWEYKYDIQPAEQYGKLQIVLTFNEAKQMTVAQMQEAFATRLAKFTEADYLLALGSPVVQMAGILAAAPLVNWIPLLVYQRGNIRYTVNRLDTRHIFWGQGNVAPQRQER
jgi:hypothetical protein